MITVTALLAEYTKNPRNIAVRVSSKEIPEHKDANGRVLRNKYTFFFDTMLVTSTRAYGEDNILLAFTYEDGKTGSCYAGGALELELLEGDELAKLMSAWEKKQFENLPAQLGHSGNVAALVECFVEDDKGTVIPSFLFLGAKDATAKAPQYSAAPLAHESRFPSEFQSSYNGCLAGTIDSLAYGFKKVRDAAKTKFPTARVSWNTVKPISQDILNAADAKQVDLTPAKVSNAYGLKTKSFKPKEIPYRAAQTGLQFAFALPKTEEGCNPIVKTMDATLGVACVSLLAGLTHEDRIKLGGLPGDYKILDYGLEYCALGNAWLCHPMIANLTFDFARKCLMLGQKGLGKFWKASEEEVLTCMMNQDVALAHTIMDRNKELMMKLFQAAWPICNGGSAAGVPNLSNEVKPEKAQATIYDIFYNGAKTIVEDPSNMTANWTLDGQWIPHSEGDKKNVWRTLNDMLGSRKFPNHVVYG